MYKMTQCAANLLLLVCWFENTYSQCLIFNLVFYNVNSRRTTDLITLWWHSPADYVVKSPLHFAKYEADHPVDDFLWKCSQSSMWTNNFSFLSLIRWYPWIKACKSLGNTIKLCSMSPVNEQGGASQYISTLSGWQTRCRVHHHFS